MSDTSADATKDHGAGARRVIVGDQRCPRCHEWFTISYWNADFLIQARCFSCDLRWPRPDVV